MAEARKASGTLALWALAYIALSFEILLHLSPLTDLGSEGYAIDFSTMLFAPFLGAWLGHRQGRAALLPLLVATPFTLIEVKFEPIGELTIFYGMGPSQLLLAAVTTLLFASPPTEEKPRMFPGMLIDALALMVLTATASAYLYLDDSMRLSIGVTLAPLAAILAFAVVASGRRSALSVILVLLVTLAVLWVMHHARIQNAFSYSPEGGAVSILAGWEGSPVPFFYAPIAAALAGAAIRDMRLANAGGEKPRAGMAMAAAAAVVLLPATLSSADQLLRQALEPKKQPEASAPYETARLIRYQFADTQPAPEIAQPGMEEVVVTGSSISDEPAQGASIYLWSLFVIAAAAFAIAQRFPRAPFFLPIALETLALAAAAAMAWLLPYDAERPLLERLIGVLMNRADGLVALGVVAWMFAWLGARTRTMTEQVS